MGDDFLTTYKSFYYTKQLQIQSDEFWPPRYFPLIVNCDYNFDKEPYTITYIQFINEDSTIEDEESIIFEEENISKHKLEFIFNNEGFVGDYDLARTIQGFILN
jgi:hypothetical protein